MKVLSITAWSLFIVLVVGYFIFDKLRPEFPVSREVTNRDGKTLDCNIVGKENGVIVVERKSDNVRFNIALDTLSLRSRLFTLILRDEPAPALPKYPIARSLKSAEGKSVFVDILGRSGGVIHVSRKIDDSRFDIEIESLSDVDREYTSRLPERVPPPIEKEAGFVETRRALIKELQTKLELYENEVASRTLNSVLERKRAEQVLELRNEIKALEVAIEGYKYRTRTSDPK
jgi:hypothetical protein